MTVIPWILNLQENILSTEPLLITNGYSCLGAAFKHMFKRNCLLPSWSSVGSINVNFPSHPRSFFELIVEFFHQVVLFQKQFYLMGWNWKCLCTKKSLTSCVDLLVFNPNKKSRKWMKEHLHSCCKQRKVEDEPRNPGANDNIDRRWSLI